MSWHARARALHCGILATRNRNQHQKQNIYTKTKKQRKQDSCFCAVVFHAAQRWRANMCCLLIVNLIEVGSVWRRTKIERDARDAAKNAYLICLMVANAAIQRELFGYLWWFAQHSKFLRMSVVNASIHECAFLMIEHLRPCCDSPTQTRRPRAGNERINGSLFRSLLFAWLHFDA